LSSGRLGEPSAVLQGWVEAARYVQRRRFDGQPDGGVLLACNADKRPAEVRKYCQLDDAWRVLMKIAMVLSEP
jgi:magnesium chelatase family protein